MTNRKYRVDDDETVTIPDFVEDKTVSDSSVDMSIFKMSDDELYDDADDDETDDFAELKPKKKKNGGKGSLIICLIIIFILLAACVGSILYALKQHEAYVKANTEYMQVQANEENYKRQLQEKDNQIAALQQQIEELKNAGTSGEGSLLYEITDGPVFFRDKPATSADKTTYNGEDSAANGEKYKVIEVVAGTDDPDYSWAKVADNVYFCVGNKEDTYAKKVD